MSLDTFEVANVEEAVELAYKMKNEGRYNWFRGQVKDWTPTSTLHRLNTAGDLTKLKQGHDSIARFLKWFPYIPQLQYLKAPEYVHDLFAIMQHYGLPTNYIDFTTDPGVAGFFAADTPNPPKDGNACIYCLNTYDLDDLWNDIKDAFEGFDIELVTINVTNLWRLQAQKGVFLFAGWNWDSVYPMDKIIFPYSGFPSSPTRDHIYPPHKSQLEQILDQYFELEFTTLAMKDLQSFVNKSSDGLIIWNEPAERFFAEAFIDSTNLVPLESWKDQTLQTWNAIADEDYHQTVGTMLKIKLNPNMSPEEVKKSVTFGVKQILSSDTSIRFKTLDWIFIDLPEALTQAELAEVTRTIWNGMRRLPFLDDEIAEAIGNTLALKMLGLGRIWKESQYSICSQYFGETISVGFANQDKSGSIAWAARNSLQKALRPDIQELLTPNFKPWADDIKKLFGIIYNPKLLFDYDSFRSMFACEIIPTQVLIQRSLIVFNIASLITFGNP